jgi:hypothetical protein
VRASQVIGVAFLALSLFATARSQNPESPVEPETVADEPGSQQSGSGTSSSRWEWGFTLRNRTGFRLIEPHTFQMSRTTFTARTDVKINDNWRVTLDGLAHYDPVGRLGYPTTVWFDPRQAYVDGRIKGVDVRLGLQQIVWGEADGLRVLDVINPLDYREFILEDFLDSRRPLWAAKVDVPAAGGSFQFVWVPYFASGRVPVGDDEFALGPSYGLGLIGAALGDPSLSLPLRIEPTVRPPFNLASSQAGARYRRSIGAWDVTANYFYGWEDIATNYLSAIDSSTPQPTLEFSPRHDRKEVFGITGTNNFGPVVLRVEAGWNINKPIASTRDSSGIETHGQFSSVAGLDYSPAEWVSLSGQYFLQFTSAPQAALLFPRYSHLASFYVQTSFFREKLRPELFVLTGLNIRQYMVRPRVVRTLGDHWSVALGADFLGGAPITPFGYLSSRDRVTVEVKIMW